MLTLQEKNEELKVSNGKEVFSLLGFLNLSGSELSPDLPSWTASKTINKFNICLPPLGFSRIKVFMAIPRMKRIGMLESRCQQES